MAFTHLHVHTEYSLLDGSNKIKEYVARVKELGMDSAAITDHGVMYGVIDFYRAAKAAGINPILGCEVYVAPGSRFDREIGSGDDRYYHLVLLAENNQGYQNLMKIVSKSFKEGFYYKPRVDLELLREYHEGLIALSACLAGEVARFLNRGMYPDAKKAALRYQEIFGEGNFFLELQDHGIPEQQNVNQQLLRMHQETGIDLVATNDIHYTYKEDADPHDILLCLQTGKKLSDTDRMRYEGGQYYVKSEQEMAALFPYALEALENTHKIAERCHVEIEFGVTKLPRFDVPEGYTSWEYLNKLCFEGLERLYDPVTPELRERLEYELNTIKNMGYVDYFLIVWDFIHYARSNGIEVGPGRGSAAGSIVAYTLGITLLDPIKYDLLFERFLNPERVSMPDIDVDFGFERRQEVIDYVVRKYGKDCVVQIVTFGTLAARGVIRDVGRVLDMPYAQVDSIAKMVPAKIPNVKLVTIDKAMEVNPELKKAYDEQPDVHHLIDMAKRLEGLPRHTSMHAAGVVISQKDVSEYVPLSRAQDGTIVTQFVMTTLEELGLLKMDFLGLRTLTVINNAVKNVKKNYGISLDMQKIDYNDQKVLDSLGTGRTDGVFQLESGGMKGFMKELKPHSLEDVIAGISLYRPGPMDFIPQYIRGKNRPDTIHYDCPQLEPILKATHGCIVYQEQVMQIVQSLAGFTLGRSDLLRRAMSKKKLKDIQREREAFLHGDPERNIAGCAANGIPQEIAESIYDEITDFANYAFNKAHAVCYAIVAYQTAWFKCHYPREYMAALLTSVLDSQDKIAEYIAECRSLGIRLLPPDVNESGSDFTVAGQDIRFGLAALKGVGRGFTKSILTCRETDGPFVSFLDFCKRMLEQDMNKRMLESLIRAGGFDSMGLRRSQLLDAYEQLLDSLTRNKRKNLEGQFDLFSQTEDGSEPTVELVLRDLPEFSPQELMTMEKEVTGLYLSGHPMDAYRELARNHGAIPIASVLEDFAQPEGPTRFQDGERINLAGVVSAAKTKTTKNNSLMAYVTLEDDTGSMELLAFSRVLEESGNYLQVNLPILVYGRISVRDEKAPQLMCDRVTPLNQVPDQPLHPGNPAERSGKLYLRFDNENDPRFQRIKNLLILFPGNQQAVLYLSDTGRRLGARCQLHPALLEELRELLGEENVVLKQ